MILLKTSNMVVCVMERRHLLCPYLEDHVLVIDGD